jgi:hypothetical protein
MQQSRYFIGILSILIWLNSCVTISSVHVTNLADYEITVSSEETGKSVDIRPRESDWIPHYDGLITVSTVDDKEIVKTHISTSTYEVENGVYCRKLFCTTHYLIKVDFTEAGELSVLNRISNNQPTEE